MGSPPGSWAGAGSHRSGVRAGIPAAALAALLLAGCSSGYVGESWQCPLAEGGTCDSVAAADPAVPDPDAARNTVLADPLWRVRGAVEATASSDSPCASECGAEFDPFGWLVRLFGGTDGADAGDRARPGKAAPAPAGLATDSRPASGNAVREPDAAAFVPDPANRKPPPGVPAAALPAEPGPAEDDLREDDLRTGEVLARIWIAPFVDANGVYREASHVRVVLEPAGWRLK